MAGMIGALGSAAVKAILATFLDDAVGLRCGLLIARVLSVRAHEVMAGTADSYARAPAGLPQKIAKLLRILDVPRDKPA